MAEAIFSKDYMTWIYGEWRGQTNITVASWDVAVGTTSAAVSSATIEKQKKKFPFFCENIIQNARVWSNS